VVGDLERDRHQLRAALGQLAEVGLEGPQLQVAVRAPLAAVEDQQDRAVMEQLSQRDLLAALVGKRELGRRLADLRRARGEVDGIESLCGGGESCEQLARGLD
jgi:hypothetical protein